MAYPKNMTWKTSGKEKTLARTTRISPMMTPATPFFSTFLMTLGCSFIPRLNHKLNEYGQLFRSGRNRLRLRSRDFSFRYAQGHDNGKTDDEIKRQGDPRDEPGRIRERRCKGFGAEV